MSRCCSGPSGSSPQSSRVWSTAPNQLYRTEGAHEPGMPAIAARQAEIGEQPRHPLVEHGVVVAAGLLAKSAGQPTFADAGWAFEDQVLLGLDPAAVGELLEQGAVEAAGSPPVDVLDTGLVAQLGEPQPGLEPAVLSLGDLAVEQQAEPLGWGELAAARVGGQFLKGPRHAGEAELVQLVEGGMGQHGLSLLNGSSRSRGCSGAAGAAPHSPAPAAAPAAGRDCAAGWRRSSRRCG